MKELTLAGGIMLAEEVIDKVTEICREHAVKKVILYGSRAKGTARERSDIDIAVCGTKDFDRLLEDIENIPTLYTVDLVDLDTCTNTFLGEDINAYGRKNYEEI